MITGLKRSVRAAFRRLKSAYFGLNPLTPERFAEALRKVGLQEGDVVLAHVSMNGFASFTGKPSAIVEVLRKVVGRGGTILMPSQPFTGSALAYVRSGEVFDVRRTGSRMGIVTELFRRHGGILRSLHPTHSVLAGGPRAAELVKDHELARTPCGDPSPYAKLAAANGKVLLLGTGIGVLTFWHYLEELLEDLMPSSPFAPEIHEVAFKGHGGEMLSVKTRFFDPAMSKRRNLKILEQALKQAGVWHEKKVGPLQIVLLRANEIETAARALLMRGTSCYESRRSGETGQ
jgi:aminoglycoside 3-N-acetyltransferase